MPRKKPDFTEIAFRVFKEAIGEPVWADQKSLSPKAAAGQRGGLKGGKARAKSLSPQKRREIAKNAARKRWAKKDNSSPAK